MDWSNERYVRLYTRLTPDQSTWCWQALAIWPWLLARADRAGVIDARRGASAVSGAVRMPLEVVGPGLEELLADGCLRQVQGGYAIPNYIEAQTAVSSDTKRKADQRARERLHETLNCDDANKSVTRGHAASRAVTESHAMSLRSERGGAGRGGSEEEEILSGKPDALSPVKPDPGRDLAVAACMALNMATGSRYKPESGETAKLCRALAKLRRTTDQVERVIADRVSRWGADAKMAQHLTPATLLAARNFSKYLDEIDNGARLSAPGSNHGEMFARRPL